MSLDSRHPSYIPILPDWQKMRVAYAGERAVKEAGVTYLPPTSGMNAKGMSPNQPGWLAYQAYKTRAVYPDFVSEAVKAMIGVMHSKDAVIELPPAMEPLRDKTTVTGEGLNLLLRRINEAQLTTGRIGLLADAPEGKTSASLPYIATYDAERITNWDDGAIDAPTMQALNLVVLNEAEYERTRDGFEWKLVNKWRVLIMGQLDENESFAVYRQGSFKDTNTYNDSDLMEPNIRGANLDQIPFVVINATDLLLEPQSPPLLPLADRCMTIYRGEADYRQSLFMQGQDTLVVIGGNEETTYMTGALGCIIVPDGPRADAKYIGVGSTGLAEQRQALENDSRRAAEIGGQLIDSTSRVKESGEALKTRVAAQTATLNQIALAGGAGLQDILRKVAVWIGADPKLVNVYPNMEFADEGMTAADFLALQQGKALGAPLSDESIHAMLKESEFTALTYAEEMAKIAVENQQKVIDGTAGIQ
jgi:hypothetical protein